MLSAVSVAVVLKAVLGTGNDCSITTVSALHALEAVAVTIDGSLLAVAAVKTVAPSDTSCDCKHHSL